MDVAQIRMKVAEFRRLAAELEALLPPPVVAEVFEEDIVIVDEDFLDTMPKVRPAVFSSEDFNKDISDTISRILCEYP